MCLWGSKGTILCDNTSDTMQLWTLGEDGIDVKKEPEILPVDINNHNVTAEIKDMALAIINNTELECDVYEGSNTVAVGIAAVESAAQGGLPVEPRYAKKN